MQIAKRENNNKRNFLVVNENQGKHVPVKPSIPLNLFEDLAKKVKAELGNRKILVIGFAETATAIGTHMALSLNSPYIQTTREVMEEEFIYFSEAHSHATEQKVVSRFIEETDFHTILFVEDEVTTGNTILNGISAIEKHFNKKFNYGVCSLINGMSDENINKFKDLNIDVIYLEKLVNNGFEEIANSFSSNGIYVKCQNIQSDCKTITIKKEIEPRSGVYPEALKNACNNVWLKVKDFSLKGNVLVIGTEEFMYLPMYIAGKIEEQGNTVYYHATTRSPIVVCTDSEYPLNSRYEIKSLYDESRTTYIYNLKKYDAVLIVTDGNSSENYLVNALKTVGNETIYKVVTL